MQAKSSAHLCLPLRSTSAIEWGRSPSRACVSHAYQSFVSGYRFRDTVFSSKSEAPLGAAGSLPSRRSRKLLLNHPTLRRLDKSNKHIDVLATIPLGAQLLDCLRRIQL